jgi:anti-sigma B factor antagonist
MNPGTAKRRSIGTQTQSGNKIGAQCFVETARIGSAVYLVLIGELDLSCTERFRSRLDDVLADSPEDVVIDLRSTTFVDSTGLALLLRVDSRSREDGYRLHVVQSQAEIVNAVFEASGVKNILPLCDDPPKLNA